MYCIRYMHVYLVVSVFYDVVFFFKQKTAYEMRISDWSSDVCSSDLEFVLAERVVARAAIGSAAQLMEFSVAGSTLAFRTPRSESTIVIRNWMEVQIGRASCRERVCQYV